MKSKLMFPILFVFCLIIQSCNKNEGLFSGKCEVSGQVYHSISGIEYPIVGNAHFYVFENTTTVPVNPKEGYAQLSSYVDGEYTFYEVGLGDYYLFVEYEDSLGNIYSGGDFFSVGDEDTHITNDIIVY